MSAKDRVNLNIFAVVLFIVQYHCVKSVQIQNYFWSIFGHFSRSVCQMAQCIVLTVQCFHLWRKKGSSLFLSTRYKRIAITFHKDQRLNTATQYHKDATQVAPGIIEKSEEPHNITPRQIDETLQERQIKYPKIVQDLDSILYFQRISYRGTQETAASSDTL